TPWPTRAQGRGNANESNPNGRTNAMTFHTRRSSQRPPCHPRNGSHRRNGVTSQHVRPSTAGNRAPKHGTGETQPTGEPPPQKTAHVALSPERRVTATSPATLT